MSVPGKLSISALFPACVAALLFPALASAATLPATISTDYTLVASKSPYTGTSVTVAPTATLTIEPGVVIKLSAQLIVTGTLDANGTIESPVTFTSIKDDTVGGDTNGDGKATSPTAGDWPGIRFPEENNATKPSTLDHVRLLYGGRKTEAALTISCKCPEPPALHQSIVAYSKTAGVTIVKGSPTISDSTIEDSGASGITVSSASPHINGNTIRDNDGAGVVLSAGEKQHASVDINNNVIKDNTANGISVSADAGLRYIDSASLGGNVIEDNGGKGVSYAVFPNSAEDTEFANDPVPANITTNTLSGNAQNGIWVSGRVGASMAWGAPGYALVISQGGLNIGKDATLTLAAGAIIKNEKGSIYVHGALRPEGSSESPVTLTSYRDDSVGGDTNGDGAATTPAPGDWTEVDYPDAKEVVLTDLDLRYAETAIYVHYLDALEIAQSDFVFNERAIDVAETAENSPELSALDCVPPYLSVVVSTENWYGYAGLPGPSVDLSDVIGAELPEECAPLFSGGASLAQLDFELYGAGNTIPFAIYSCPVLGIPPIPVTPVVIVDTPSGPWFPDPQVE